MIDFLGRSLPRELGAKTQTLPPPPRQITSTGAHGLFGFEPVVGAIALAAIFGQRARPFALQASESSVQFDMQVADKFLTITRWPVMEAGRSLQLAREKQRWNAEAIVAEEGRASTGRSLAWPAIGNALRIHPDTDPSNPYHLWAALTLEHVRISDESSEPKQPTSQSADLVHLENITGLEARELRSIVERLVARAQQLLDDGSLRDGLEESLVKSAVEHLHVRVLMTDDPEEGYSTPVIYSLALDLLARISDLEMRNDPGDIERLGADLVGSALKYDPEDPSVPHEVAKIVASHSGGAFSKQDALIAILGGNATFAALATVADIGLIKSLIAAGSSVGAIMVALIGISWTNRSKD